MEENNLKMFVWKGLQTGRMNLELLVLKELERIEEYEAAILVRDTINEWNELDRKTFKKELLIEKYK